MYGYTDDELASLRIGAPALLRALEKSQQNALDKLYTLYTNGKTDFLGAVSEYAAIRMQIFNLTAALNQGGTKKGANNA